MDKNSLKPIGFVLMIVVGASSVFMPVLVVAILALIAAYNALPIGEMSGLWAGLAGLSALLGGWFIVQGVQGLRGRPSAPFYIARPWLWVALLVLTLGLIAVASDAAAIGGVAQVLGALLPGIALLAFASQGLAFAAGPATWRQIAAQVSATLTVSLGWSIFLEIVALAGLAIAVGVVLSLLPDGLSTLEQLQEQFADPSVLIGTDIWSNPGVLAFFLVLMAGLVPPIEEIGKLLAVGMLALVHRPSRAQALMWGIACGVTFSVYEAAFANPYPGVGAVVLALRVGAMLIHATTAALTAWGLWEWLARRKPGFLALGLALAIALHGAWNVVAISWVALQATTDSPWLIGLLAAPFLALSVGAAGVLARVLEPSQLVHVLHIERGEDT